MKETHPTDKVRFTKRKSIADSYSPHGGVVYFNRNCRCYPHCGTCPHPYSRYYNAPLALGTEAEAAHDQTSYMILKWYTIQSHTLY